MIAILKTRCGCERAMNVDYHFPHTIRVPLDQPPRFIAEASNFHPAINIETRTFQFYRKLDGGELEYREA